MRFVKMQGTGNDFVLIDSLENPLEESLLPGLAKRLCDRRFGIGSDGLLLVLPSQQAHFRIRMFNPDGSEAEMCGNGIRCFAKYLYDHHRTSRTELTVETAAGIKTLRLFPQQGVVRSVRVAMGAPRLARAEIPMRGEPSHSPVINQPLLIQDHCFEITCVNVGNPHCVIFVEDVTRLPVSTYGPQIEHHELFPQRINVQFAQVLSDWEIRLRTWERGAGETLGCGTGACATAVAAAITNRAARNVVVHLPGGDLQIEWAEDGSLYMTGTAEEVFWGEIKETT